MRARRSSILVSLVVAGTLFASVARADDASDVRTLPCRPTIACTADLVPPGAFELEAGVLHRRIDSVGRQWTFPFLAKLTLAEWVQVQIGSNGYSFTRGAVPAQFLDDITIGVKLHLVDQRGALPSIAISGTASIPTFEGDHYFRTYDALFTAYATKDVAWLHADMNLGASLWRIDGAPLPQEWAALALSAPLVPPFGAMIEGYYFTDASPVAARDGGVLFAISHSPKPWLVFDFGGDVGWFPSTRAYSVFVGTSIVPARLW